MLAHGICSKLALQQNLSVQDFKCSNMHTRVERHLYLLSIGLCQKGGEVGAHSPRHRAVVLSNTKSIEGNTVMRSKFHPIPDPAANKYHGNLLVETDAEMTAQS